MIALFVAVSAKVKPRFEEEFDERTAGTWRKSVQIVALNDLKEHKESNNGDVDHLARTTDATIVAANDLTSKCLEDRSNVKRLSRPKLIQYVNDWFLTKGISWRANVDEARRHSAYRWVGVSEWREQFNRVDPVRGLRVAAAILVQLKIARVSEIAEWFDGLSPVEHNAFFVGSDPHSGDFGIINTLAARIPGQKLTEVRQLPELAATDHVRLFSDGGWSGGESVRRLECMYQSCCKKARSLGPDNSVSMRFAYLTDVAESALKKKVDDLIQRGLTKRVHISCPPENRLLVEGEHGVEKGLAFQDSNVCAYVDLLNPGAMRELCRTIGEQLAERRPLGTHEIASTIAFEHSLPKAMLPVLITGGQEVRAHDGQTFIWKPLLSSQHVSNPAEDQKGYYCETCPLAS